MIDLGYLVLYLALGTALYAILASLLGDKAGRERLLFSARAAIYAVCGLTTLASLVLLYALVIHDFRVAYVANYTSRDLPLFYTLSAFWAGQEGSLLLWAWLLSIVSAVAVAQNWAKERELVPRVMTWLMLTEAFFLVLITLVANPFKRLDFIPADGLGLNPLLRNLGMIFHPPATYIGYVGFTVPFAFAMAALMTGHLDDAWIHIARRWTLLSWVFLSLGIGLGAQWAYMELGWGGYWAWDPVENASLIPWLTGTAFLHSVTIQERRGMLKAWNLVLIVLTFLLCIFGTFITRSGIVESVHSFAASPLGLYFLFYLGFTSTLFALLLLDRRPLWRSKGVLVSLLSRESAFLLNNLFLLGVALVILLGTIFPLISEAAIGKRLVASAPFFERVNGPIFLALVFLMGVCPLIGWRRASKESLLRNFSYPLAVAFLVAVALYFLGVREPYALPSFSLSSFVLVTIISQLSRGLLARHRLYQEDYLLSTVNLVRRHRERYAGYIVHLGVILVIVGVTASTIYKVEAEKSLLLGESMTIRDYAITYEGLRSLPEGDHWAVVADLSIAQGGRPIGNLFPEVDIYCGSGETTSEVALRSTPLEDLYLVLAGLEYQLEPSKATPCGFIALLGEDQTVVLKSVVNPLVGWIWVGGMVLIAGTLIATWPQLGRNSGSSIATGLEER